MAPLRSRLAAIPVRHLVLFLDFDGTLAPIASHPNKAKLERPVRETLRRLAKRLPVVIISGRALSDLRLRVGLSTVCYVGHHGWSCRETGKPPTWLAPPPSRRSVHRWFVALREAARGIAGAVVEHKGVSVSLHDRSVKTGQRARLKRRALRLVAPWISNGSAALLRGKRVLEVRSPRSWNKGSAVESLMRRSWARGRVPLYLGDDNTDIEAFPAVRRHHGFPVAVGKRLGRENAMSRLPDGKAVHKLLQWLAQRA
jgi:trehalose-phosphatase